MFSINLGKDRLGERFEVKGLGVVEIIEYVTNSNLTVRFEETGYITKTRYHLLKTGRVIDRLRPTVYGVGIVGYENVSENGKLTQVYETWKSMLMRCYCLKQKGLTRYKDVFVCEDFKHLPVFSKWAKQQVGFGRKGWQLDKDLLVRGNKVYSPDACCFIPPEINSLICDNTQRSKSGLPVGVSRSGSKFCTRARFGGATVTLGLFDTVEEAFQAYKEAKEAYIKGVAEKWKDQIDQKVYEALMNWKIMAVV